MLTVVLCATLFVSCTAQQDVYSRPDEKYAPSASLHYEQDTVRYKDSAIMIEVTYLSPHNLDVYFQNFQGGKFMNPFTPSAHMVFAVTMENLSDGAINYNPGLTLFITEYDKPLRPKDYSSLYTDFEIVEAPDIDARMAAYKATCFDNSVLLQPGERIKKLLVFPLNKDSMFESMFKGVFVFSSVYLDYKSRDIPIEFRGKIQRPEPQ